jgi:hypothetical protein
MGLPAVSSGGGEGRQGRLTVAAARVSLPPESPVRVGDAGALPGTKCSLPLKC